MRPRSSGQTTLTAGLGNTSQFIINHPTMRQKGLKLNFSIVSFFAPRRRRRMVCSNSGKGGLVMNFIH